MAWRTRGPGAVRAGAATACQSQRPRRVVSAESRPPHLAPLPPRGEEEKAEHASPTSGSAMPRNAASPSAAMQWPGAPGVPARSGQARPPPANHRDRAAWCRPNPAPLTLLLSPQGERSGKEGAHPTFVIPARGADRATASRPAGAQYPVRFPCCHAVAAREACPEPCRGESRAPLPQRTQNPSILRAADAVFGVPSAGSWGRL